MRILLINPNTSETMTEMLRQRAVTVASLGTEIEAVAAPFGAVYLANRSETAIAAHAAITVLAERAEVAMPDGVVIAAFTDAGLGAARELVSVPVAGIAESAMRAAAKGGRRFAIVTSASGLVPVIAELARYYGLDESFAGVYAAAPDALDPTGDMTAAAAVFADLAHRAVQSGGAEAIILGGAPFAMLAGELQRLIGRPVYEGVAAAVARIEDAWRAGGERNAVPDAALVAVKPGARKPARGVSPALARRLGLDLTG